MLPDFGQDGNRDRGMNIKNQGFYILRNYREVATGETFGQLLPGTTTTTVSVLNFTFPPRWMNLWA